MTYRTTAICLALSCAGPLHRARAEPVNVYAEQLACVFENADHYLSQSDEVLVILLGACPESDLGTMLFRSTRNSAAVVVETVPDSAERPAEVIALSHEQLSCLVAKRASLIEGAKAPVITIDPDACP